MKYQNKHKNLNIPYKDIIYYFFILYSQQSAKERSEKLVKIVANFDV